MVSHSKFLVNHRSSHKHVRLVTMLLAFSIGSFFLLLALLGSAASVSAAPTAFDCATVSEIPQSECNALVTFFADTNGTSWTTKTNWLETNTPCGWYRITCTFSGQNILRIILNNNQLSGTIPPQLEQLSQLDWLDLSKNELTGEIPPELGNLTNLHILYLHNNKLTGSIPPQLGNFPKLDQLYLLSNQLTGPIPDDLRKLTRLRILLLGGNQLTGLIPTWWENMPNLVALDLRENQFTGPIPPSLSSLGNLIDLFLNHNQLSGSIPPELGEPGKLPKLDKLWLHHNQLTGPIPPELGNLTSLQQLYLGENPLTGSIPPDFGKLVNVRTLYLPSAQLTGSVPSELGSMSNLSGLSLQDNQLTGVIPPALGNLSRLAILYLDHNRLSGSIPNELGKLSSLVYLRLQDNQLTGSIPTDLGKLSNLEQFYLLNNQLSGEIPDSLGGLVNAHIFLLANNAFTGEVPISITNVGKNWIATHGGTIGIDLNYNALRASDLEVQKFLIIHNPAFLATQTLPPTDLQVTNVQSTRVDLAWLPPAYSSDLGGYEVRITQPDGSSELREIANDKKVVAGTVSNLCPGTTYGLALRTHTAPHGAQQNHLRSEFSPAVNATTLPRTSGLLALYILALDSNLDEQYTALLQAIQAATQQDFGKAAVVLVDRKGENNTHMLHIECGISEVIQGLPNPTTGQLDPTLREYNMADPAALGAFIKWARQSYNFSAEGYPPTILSYVGHGVAIAPDTDVSKYVRESITETIDAASLNENSGFQPLPPTQTKINMTPDQLTDATSKSLISPYALASALYTGTLGGTQPLTLLDIIHCFGGTIEEFYELAHLGGDLAQVITGSPNYAYAGADMLGQALLAIQPTQSPREMAAKVVQAYDRVLHEADLSDDDADVDHPRIIVAVESSKIPAIKTQLDQLATGLLEEFDRDPAGAMDKIMAAQTGSVKFDTTTCKLEDRPQDFELNSEDGLADLADFAVQLKAQFVTSADGLATDVMASNLLTATDQLVASVNAAVITTTHTNGNPWFAKNPALVWNFDRAKGIGLFTDFNGITLQDKIYVGWQAYWYNRDNSTNPEENPHPYKFVENGGKNWSDLFARFWEERLGQNGEVGTYACSTTLPEVRVIKDWLYLPVIGH